MNLFVDGSISVELKNTVFLQVLNIYPEEKLTERPIFKEALDRGCIDFNLLRSECEKISLAWQFFFLDDINLKRQIDHIEDQRKIKISAKLFSKRQGIGKITSKRIVDRLIRQQNYLLENNDFPTNDFCGLLDGDFSSFANLIRDYFEIDMQYFWRIKSKGDALGYLVKQVEKKNINVSRGVLTNGILPYLQSSRDVYKNTSGFIISDYKVPFIFLPSEINPDEVDSRQIYTLLYLLSLIGLDKHQYSLDKELNAIEIKELSQTEKKVHFIVGEFLMPSNETSSINNSNLDKNMLRDLGDKYKISPTALLTILLIRKNISREKYKKLLPPPFNKDLQKKRILTTPNISTSVKKFCGIHSYEAINIGIRTNQLPSTQAQYLLFGCMNKKRYMKYCKELNI